MTTRDELADLAAGVVQGRGVPPGAGAAVDAARALVKRAWNGGREEREQELALMTAPERARVLSKARHPSAGQLPDGQGGTAAVRIRAGLTEGEAAYRSSRPVCPDGGTCHHGCTRGCFRVRAASPLAVAGWGDTWPEHIREAYTDTDGAL